MPQLPGDCTGGGMQQNNQPQLPLSAHLAGQRYLRRGAPKLRWVVTSCTSTPGIDPEAADSKQQPEEDHHGSELLLAGRAGVFAGRER